jgi:hypothetical protein
MTDNTGSIRLRTSGSGDFVLFTGGSATSQNASGSTQALLIDQAQNASFAGYVTSSDYLQHFSYLYSRDNLRVLNAAGNGWHDWATRSNGTFNLNIGTISSGAITATTVNTGHGANELYAMNQNVRTSDSPTFQDLTVQGNLSITGDINSYNVTDLDVTDKTITVGAGQTEANSGGSGLIVDGSGAQMLWDEGDNRFEFNKNVYTTGQWQGNGSGLNTLNASNLSSGTVPEARLPTQAKYLRSDANDTATGTITFNSTPILTGTSSNEGGELNFGAPTGGVYSSFALDNYQGHFRVHTLASGKEFRIHSASSGLTTIGSNLGTVWGAGNDGSGSGLDADLLDGLHAASFLRSDTADVASGTYIFSRSSTTIS